MPTGCERAVLCWDARLSLLRIELERIERELERTGPATGMPTSERRAALERDRAQVLSRIHALGPSPRAKMG